MSTNQSASSKRSHLTSLPFSECYHQTETFVLAQNIKNNCSCSWKTYIGWEESVWPF